MIDWLDLVVSIPHEPFNFGHVLFIKPSGELDYGIAKSAQVAGSYDSTVRVRSQGAAGGGLAQELYISGNPSKFLQGHNVFGSQDICLLASEMVKAIFASLEFDDDLGIARVRAGNFDVKRIDITESWAFRSREEVQAVLSALAIKSRSRLGRPQTRGGTVYHGMNSRRHTFKFYCKGDELEAGKKHRLHETLENSPIKEFADNLLRGELTLRSKELKELELSRGTDLTPEKCNELYAEYFGRIEMAAQADIPSEEVMALTRAHRSTYLLWKEGIDVRTMASKATFFRHRSKLLQLGVDIALPCESSDCKIIPLFQTVIGSPVAVPDWAYKSGYVVGGRP